MEENLPREPADHRSPKLRLVGLAAFSDVGEGGSAGVRALVNLGGVLVTVHKLDEAWVYNAYRAFC